MLDIALPPQGVLVEQLDTGGEGGFAWWGNFDTFFCQ